MRVLLSAYVCRPGYGSEPSVGWEFLRAAAKEHEVVLLTLPDSVEEIRCALAAEQLEGVEIVGLPSPRVLRRFEGRLGLGHLDYLLWQVSALRVARRRRTDVDVAHHVTFGNDWLPCALHFLSGVAVVWGPVGGAGRVPFALLRYLSKGGVLRELGRGVVTPASRRLTAALARRRHCLVVAVNNETAERFRRLGVQTVVEPHVAMPPLDAQLQAAEPATVSDAEPGIRTAIFASRLQAWKGPYLALEAFSRLPAEWRLDVYGAGGELEGLRSRVEHLRLSDRVRFVGRVPLEELRTALGRADVLLFTSMHDAAPYTVAEAVRVGCPVVCLDIAGPPLLIEGTSGIAVAPDGRAAQRLAEAACEVRRDAPSDRWGSDRLAAHVSGWYEQATTLFLASARG